MAHVLSFTSEVTAIRPTRRVALFGHFGSGNLGNDGSLEAFLHALRKAPFPVEVSCICTGEPEVQRRFAIPTVAIAAPPSNRMAAVNKALLKVPNRFRNFARAVAISRSFDAIIVPGTGILDDFGERWQGMPYHLALWGAAARLAGTPFAFVSIGAGPIRHPASRRLMVLAARLSRYRSFRDDASSAYLAKLGVDTAGDATTPDIAFALDVPRACAAQTLQGDELPTIGLGIMGYYGWKHRQADGLHVYEQYIEKLTSFSLWLLENGFQIRLLMGGHEDFRAIEDMSHKLNAHADGMFQGRIRAEPANSLAEVMKQMANVELVIATRFHNVVCALMMQKPVISISYALKNDRLLAHAGLEEYTQNIEELDIEKLKQQFLKLRGSLGQYAPRIARMTEEFQGQLETQNKRIFKFIESSCATQTHNA